MSERLRARLLCEDRRSERFLRRMCERYEVDVLRDGVTVAPSGEGDASAWVKAQYPKWVRLHRAKRHQRNLCLLVHIDGDNLGVAARKGELDDRLVQISLARRGDDEKIAIFVPTWCIETWLLHLAGIAQPSEAIQVKRDPGYASVIREIDEDESAVIRKAVSAWPRAGLPSLIDGAEEGRRVDFA